MPASSHGPLSGVTVLDLSSYLAGPYGCTLLADLGADVIKIEERAASGDMSRGVGPHHLGPHDSTFYQPYNRNKRSICLDLKSDAGRAVFHRLVGHGGYTGFRSTSCLAMRMRWISLVPSPMQSSGASR